MKAMIIERRACAEEKPLKWVERAVPEPKAGEVLIRVECCAICRTDLHVIEGELPTRRIPVVPGHQAVGNVVGRGSGSDRFQLGERVGVAWLHRSCGICPYCRRGEENLCELPEFTGYDVDGGYAQYIVGAEAFVYPIPQEIPAREAAPLLCAGIIGYRALRRSSIPKGGRLGLYGFGASAHVVIQIARYWGCEVYVCTRGEGHQELAGQLGAKWVGGAMDRPPRKLDAAILFAPLGDLVPVALEGLDRGGTLAVAGIYLSDIPSLRYERDLFYEKNLRSVTSNTRQDGRELLSLAREIPIVSHTELFSLAEANEALIRLKHDGIRGSGVLQINPEQA